MGYAARRCFANAILFACIVAAYLVFRFPPEANSFYPRCPVFTLFNVLCPGCGATRAIASLFRGNLTDALHFNALIVVLLPFLSVFFSVCYWRAMLKSQFNWPIVPQTWLGLCLALVLVFAVARNLYPI